MPFYGVRTWVWLGATRAPGPSSVFGADSLFIIFTLWAMAALPIDSSRVGYGTAIGPASAGPHTSVPVLGALFCLYEDMVPLGVSEKTWFLEPSS